MALLDTGRTPEAQGEREVERRTCARYKVNGPAVDDETGLCGTRSSKGRRCYISLDEYL